VVFLARFCNEPLAGVSFSILSRVDFSGDTTLGTPVQSAKKILAKSKSVSRLSATPREADAML
jgi:hypothetical protein